MHKLSIIIMQMHNPSHFCISQSRVLWLSELNPSSRTSSRSGALRENGPSCRIMQTNYGRQLHNDYAKVMHNDYAKVMHNDYAKDMQGDYAR